MRYTFRTTDDPQAGGRANSSGEARYTLSFPLDNGGWLTVNGGEKMLRDIVEGLRKTEPKLLEVPHGQGH